MSEPGFYGEAICAIGAFDGVHLGHQYLLQAAQQQADKAGLPCLVVTFDRDPDDLLAPQRTRKLLADSERLQRLGCLDYGGPGLADPAQGITDSRRRLVLALPFEPALAGLAPLDFLNEVLAAHCEPRGIHVGSDFRFGAQAGGNVATLQQWALAHGAAAFGHELLDDTARPVSATRIRDCLASGELAEANRLLTRPHHLRGQIVQGRGFGHQMGFPTANIAGLDGVMQPADGVYAGWLEADGQLLPAAISVGVPLTFGELAATLEVYILDFSGDIYNQVVTVHFREYLRPMQAFADVQALTSQIARDVERTRELTAETGR